MRRSLQGPGRSLRHVLLSAPIILIFIACVTTGILHSTSPRVRALLPAPSAASNQHCDVRSQTWEKRCEFVRAHAEECGSDQGIVPYLEVAYCYLGDWPVAAAALIGSWLLLLFSVMLASADHFFCPALEELSDALGLPDHLAGATLMAFGNGASDVFTMVAALASEKNDAGVSTALSEALSSGLFVTNVVLGAVLLFAPSHPIYVSRRTFLQDVLFYLGAVLLVLCLIMDRKLHFWEGLLLFGYYIVYLVRAIVSARGEAPLIAPHPKPGIHHEIPHGGPRHPFMVADLEALDEVMPLEAPLLPASGSIGSRIATQGSNTSATSSRPDPPGAPGGSSSRGPPPRLADTRQVSNISQVVVEQLGAFERLREVVEWPVVFVLRLFMPQVDPKATYPRWCAVSLPLCGPLLWMLAAGTAPWRLGLAGTANWLGLGALGAGLVWSAYPEDGRSFGPFAGVFAVAAFVQAMTLLSLASGELMAACGGLGIMAGLPRTFLAATIMAWGNSLQDLVANVSMSASGFPLVAVTACIAAPLFNMLTGIGLGVALHTLRFGPITGFVVPNAVLLLFASHVLLLVRYCLEVPLVRRWAVPRATGAISLAAYVAIMPLYVLTSMGLLFKRPWLE